LEINLDLLPGIGSRPPEDTTQCECRDAQHQNDEQEPSHCFDPDHAVPSRGK
jgi:hypothetical protein